MMTSYQRTFFIAFFVATVICLSPVKLLAYVAPFLFLGIVLVFGQRFQSGVLRLMVVGAIIVEGLAFYYFLYEDFLPARYLMAAITYASFLPVLVLEAKELASRELLAKMLAFSAAIFLVEGGLGIVQALYGVTQTGGFDASNGDFVEGTIHPQLASEKSFANPMYAVNMVFMALFLLVPVLSNEKRPFGFAIGILAIILASVVHVLLYFVVAMIAAFFLLGRRASQSPESNRAIARSRRWWMMGSSMALAATVYFIGTNLALTFHVAELLLNLEIPKAVITVEAITRMPEEEPAMAVVGLGPGHFSSRAGLISTGEYFRNQIFPKLGNTPLVDKYLMPLYNEALAERFGGSSNVWPWYSLLNVYTETGLLGLLLVFSAFGYLVWKTRSRVRAHPELFCYGFPFLTGVLFLFQLALQENYWEIPQAIFTGVLILKLLYSLMLHTSEYSVSGNNK